MKTIHYKDPDKCVSEMLDSLGNEIVIAVPLGLGKPIQLLNAIYELSKTNPQIKLTIITALSLSKPVVTNDLAKRLVNPILDKIYKNYIDLEYEVDRKAQKLPSNVKVIEFYLAPGKYLGNDSAQQNYICSNYTHIVRDLLEYKVNVIAQLISCRNTETATYSLSCNADLTRDLISEIEKNSNNKQNVLYLGEVNQHLPYMYGKSAEVREDKFNAILDTQESANLFSIPRPAISEQDFMIGLYASTLIKDDSCLQIGIGSLSDALVYSLILRHKDNARYVDLLNKFKIKDKFNEIIERIGSTDTFEKGLFGSTEMFVDGFLDLYKNNILKKRVYDDVPLQGLLNERKITEKVTNKTVDLLISKKRIAEKLTKKDFDYLQYFGVFKDDNSFYYEEGYIYFTEKNKIIADLGNINSKEIILKECLGNKLKNGRIVHAGFFLGSQKLYKSLNDLSIMERKCIDMRGIKKINQLYHTEEIDALQRTNARFVNSSMKVTLLGSVISDTLKDAKVVSGVGGQYNFVAMAHELDDARSIINCKSTYTNNGKDESNIVWEYGETTIPRHLRDVFITEYGIADCRSKTDSEVIKALLNIADSRFQEKLLDSAKKAGKLPNNYQIPDLYKSNYPNNILQCVNSYTKESIYKRYPFGTELTDDEVRLEIALQYLKSVSKGQQFLLLLKGIFISGNSYKKMLIRMKLYKPKGIKEVIYRLLLLAALVTTNISSDKERVIHEH